MPRVWRGDNVTNTPDLLLQQVGGIVLPMNIEKETSVAMRAVDVLVEWDSTLDMDYNSGLAEISYAMRGVTGGTVNNIGKSKNGKYFAVVYLPLMASKLLHFDQEEFLYLLLSRYYLDGYKITGLKVSVR